MKKIFLFILLYILIITGCIPPISCQDTLTYKPQQKADIVTAINGKEIKNIYAYMYRLGELKKDSSVSVTVLRSKEIIELNIEL